jgi:hypothetical protein
MSVCHDASLDKSFQERHFRASFSRGNCFLESLRGLREFVERVQSDNKILWLVGAEAVFAKLEENSIWFSA